MMNIFSDLKVDSISVVVKKKESSDFIFNCESRNYDGFLFVTKGRGLYKNKQRKIELEKNSLVVLEKGEKYIAKALDDDFEYITTGYKILPESAVQKLGIPKFTDISGYPYIATLIEKILKTWEERSPLYTLRTRILIEQLLINLFDIQSKANLYVKSESRVSPAIEYINRFYDKPISSDDLASLCKMSVSNFRKVFKKETGILPMQYREELRIYWSKRLLRSGIFTISEIATKLGYCDVYHFSKDFKKRTGKSPKVYIENKNRKA